MDTEEVVDLAVSVYSGVMELFLIGLLLTGAAFWLPVLIEMEDWWLVAAVGGITVFLMTGLAAYATPVIGALLSSNGEVVLKTRSPNVGEVIEGRVRMGWGTFRPGTVSVQMLCREGTPRLFGGYKWRTLWMGEQREEAEHTPRGYCVPFRFEVPGNLPGTGLTTSDQPIAWGVELVSPITHRTLEGFEIQVFGPLTEAGKALKAAMRRSPEAFNG